MSSTSPSKDRKSQNALHVVDKRSGRSYDIPIIHNAIRAKDLVAIKALNGSSASADQAERGLRVYDPGYQNTCVEESEISFMYDACEERGNYSLDELYAQNDFDEVAFLLIWGHLPCFEEKRHFRSELALAMRPPQRVLDVVSSYPRDAPAYTVWFAILAAWATSDPHHIPIAVGKVLSLGDSDHAKGEVARTMGAVAAAFALTYCHCHDRRIGTSQAEKSLIENVVLMMNLGSDQNDNSYAGVVRKLNKIAILYAEHGMSNSTSIFLHSASSLADPLTSFVAAAATMGGPLHVGAIDMAYKSFERIGTPDRVPEMMERVKAGKERLFGYGHRVYKTEDPRAKHYKAILEELSRDPNVRPNGLADVAREVDRMAKEDEYFLSRGLSVNADLYASLVIAAL
ncbi:MAG: hypothetical protein Q9157_002182 [Trypethelium eluteriae]